MFRGSTQGDRGSPPPGPTHARGPAHLLRPALEPHHLDESFTGTQQTVPHVQREAGAGGRGGLRRRVYQTLGRSVELFLCVDVTLLLTFASNTTGFEISHFEILNLKNV